MDLMGRIGSAVHSLQLGLIFCGHSSWPSNTKLFSKTIYLMHILMLFLVSEIAPSMKSVVEETCPIVFI